MVQPGLGGALDTPRTNVGDATYLNRQPDFADVSMEASFQSPGKDGDFLQQLRNGRANGISLRTPRQRGPLADRRNLPQSIGGAEFTPMLKSITRNSARRQGKENGAALPGAYGMERIDEDDVTQLPRMDASLYLGSRNQSYLDNTLPQVESSSVASTPLAVQPRRALDQGPLQDGNQLSLREQETVIDRIEKENFGLKLKIHFLEEALRKAGPGYSDAALKENTDLKVDKVTMQRELHRYKKHVVSAERDLETYKQQMKELQERAKRKQDGQGHRIEVEQLQKALEEKEADVDGLQRQLDQSRNDDDQMDKLRDDMEDLRADMREKDRQITKRDDELDELRDRLRAAEARAQDAQDDDLQMDRLRDDMEDLRTDMREKDRQITKRDDELDELREKLRAAEDRAQDAQDRVAELETAEDPKEELEEAKDTIQDLELSIRRLEEQMEGMKDAANEAIAQKERAERDLEELQEEMANKSVVTKGLSRQIEEKLSRLQQELDQSGKDYADLEKELARVNEENERLRVEMEEMRAEQAVGQQAERFSSVKVQELEAELLALADERDLWQARHEALSSEVQRLEAEIQELQNNASEEKEYALEVEKDLRQQFKDEMGRLNDEVSNLQAEVRERDNLYDNDSERWSNEKQTLHAELKRAEEKAVGLQRTIDRLRQVEGSSSKLQRAMDSEAERHKSEEAVMTRQINDLQDALETRQALLTSLRNELSAVRDELRQSRIEHQSQTNKVVALEDELEVLRTKTAAMVTPGRSNAAARDVQSLRARIDRVESDLTTTRSSLAEARAERDELRERLNITARSPPSKVSEGQDLQLAQKTIRDLERKLKQSQTPHDGGNDIETLSTLRRDLSVSRQKELDFLEKEAAYRESLRELNTHIADLEQQLHEMRVSQLERPPAGSRGVSSDEDTAPLRQKLADAERALAQSRSDSHETEVRAAEMMEDLQAQLSDAERALAQARSDSHETEVRAAEMMEDLQAQLSDLEDQKIVLEEMLEETREHAEEAATQNEEVTRRLLHDLDKAQRQHHAATKSKDSKHLRKTQAEVENLESDVRVQQDLIDSLAATEAALRQKLQRTRSERAAFRMTAEKLQRDMRLLTHAQPSDVVSKRTASHAGMETLVRASQSAQDRHKKEISGLVLQMEWMHARWEREAALRSDAAFAKRFVQLQLDVAHACNKAQLRELESIRTNVLHGKTSLPPPKPSRPSIRPFLHMARFIARMRISSREWATQEHIRLKLVAARDQQRRAKRSQHLKVVRIERD